MDGLKGKLVETRLPLRRLRHRSNPVHNPTVQLDVLIVRTKHGLARPLYSPFLMNAEIDLKYAPITNAPAVEPTGFITSGLWTAFYGLVRSPGDRKNLVALLDALRREGLVAVVASPKLSTSSGTPGSFLAGGEQALPIPAGLGSIGVQFEEFGTRLNYLPTVLGDGRIRLETEPEVSSLSLADGTVIRDVIVPGRVTNRTHVLVDLKEGQTFVIGGLIEHLDQRTTKRLRVLGALPFIGPFFTCTSHTTKEEEVVIMVTPSVTDDKPDVRPSNDRPSKATK